MKILVTGGSGFIGTRLIEDLLSNNHDVIIFDKVISKVFPNLCVVGDVRDEEALISACKGVDIIFNLAAEHADDVAPISLYKDVNVHGALNLIKAAELNGVKKIVFTSSVAVYGLNQGAPNEKSKLSPFNEYGKSKLEAELAFKKWADQNGLNSLTIIRPSVVFGEGNRGNVYNLLLQIKNKRFLMVGSGENKKSMAYVGNISHFLSKLTDGKSGVQVFNYADKPDLDSKNIVAIAKDAFQINTKYPSIPYPIAMIAGYALDLMAKLLNRKFPISSIRIKKFCADTTIDTKKLEDSGFIPPFSLELGLQKMIKKDFLNKI
ncbi:NAD-dependent epimerase/dehydratase family protein [Lutimonas zeaxanthinifaciens]|uniref:NAD-dependent epimerase/dehydratase family protein n=1 Tax=Lutimonas zeaxanthinifaciens TaxID=3060215 RepID=UPI00265C9F0A|nr:NAD-dependent epimerase/dehydratase family protein [Lutimonas sp. YSD2104]WKK66836.1 NAD-dependent epimerase/dehydratase family protein [Lutimonas sp. YSD2104]